MVDGRGKAGGQVAAKNRAGAYIRNKVTPINPQTAPQQFQRQLFGALASSWRSLPDSRRDTWLQGTVNFPYRDVFGNTKYLSGPQLYQKLNSNLSVAGQPQLDLCPAPVEIPPISIDLFQNDEDGLQISINPGTIPAGYTLALYATPSLSPGKKYVKQLYKFIGSDWTVSGTIIDIAAAYALVFGNKIVGQRIFVRGHFIANSSGQAGVPVESSSVTE